MRGLLFLPAAAAALCAIPELRLPEPMVNSILIGSSSFTQNSLPLSYVSSWPVWMATPSGDAVSLLPSEQDEGWVNAATVEQLWLPLDLPSPAARAAVGAVLKNGVPRYLFPCVEATVEVAGTVWHNRGLNTIPLAKTWLSFGDVPIGDLRLSAYVQPLPSITEGDVSSNDGPAEERSVEEWMPVLPLTEVADAVNTILRVIGDAPDAMGSGFCFLLAPLSEATLPAGTISAGQRLRLFLSDVDATPTSLDPEDRSSWLWNRGECDLSMYNVAPGGESDFLPAPYRKLFGTRTDAR